MRTDEKSLDQETLEIPSTNSSLSRALLCAQAALDKKAENLQILDLSQQSGFTDYFVVCSSMSDRQTRAIADAVLERLKAEGSSPIAVEGYTDARWVLLDFGDVVVHVFLDAIRDYYQLETLWQSAPRLRVPSEYYGSAAQRLN